MEKRAVGSYAAQYEGVYAVRKHTCRAAENRVVGMPLLHGNVWASAATLYSTSHAIAV